MGRSRQVEEWRLCVEDWPPRSTKRGSPPRNRGRRTLFSRGQNSDLSPRLESPNAPQSKETTSGNDGRAAPDRTRSPHRPPQLRTGRKTAVPARRGLTPRGPPAAAQRGTWAGVDGESGARGRPPLDGGRRSGAGAAQRPCMSGFGAPPVRCPPRSRRRPEVGRLRVERRSRSRPASTRRRSAPAITAPGAPAMQRP